MKLDNAECECCKTLPPPPSSKQARQDLVKQLGLYLKLCTLLDDSRYQQQMQQQDQIMLSSKSSSSSYINRSISFIEANKLDRNFKPTVMSESIDSLHDLNLLTRKSKFKPLIPFNASNEPLIGRDWLFNDIYQALETHQLVIVCGQAGTGKTRLAHHLFQNSSTFQATTATSALSQHNINSSKTVLTGALTKYHTLNSNVKLTSDTLSSSGFQTMKQLASSLAAVHFCLADDSRTLEVSQFLRNIIWCLANFAGLETQIDTNNHANAYMSTLVQEDEHGSCLINELASEHFDQVEPELVLDKFICNPLEKIAMKSAKLGSSLKPMIIIVDGLYGHSKIGNFLANTLGKFPSYLKFLVTARNEKLTGGQLIIDETCTIALDVAIDNMSISMASSSSSSCRMKNSTSSFSSMDENSSQHDINACGSSQLSKLNKDISDYISFRIGRSLDIQKNILHFNCFASNLNCTNTIDSSNATTTLITTTNGIAKSSSSSTSGTAISSQLPSSNLTSSSNNLNRSVLNVQLSTSISAASSRGLNASTMSKADSNFQLKFIQYLGSLSRHNFLFVKLMLDLIERGSLVIKSANFKVLPKNMDELLKLHFNLKFPSRLSYDRLAVHIFSICLASFKPLTLNEIYETINCACIHNDKYTWTELMNQMSQLCEFGFFVPFRYFDPDFDRSLTSHDHNQPVAVRTPSYRFTHPIVREWWMSRDQSNRLALPRSCDLRLGHFLIGIRTMRTLDIKLANTRTCLDLMRHLLMSYEMASNQEEKKLLNYAHVTSYMICLNLVPSDSYFYTKLLVSTEFIDSPDPQLFRVLLNLGANYNTLVTHHHRLPFVCMLASLGHTHLLAILVREYKVLFDCSETSPVQCRDPENGTNCLLLAVQNKHVETARFILENSLDPLNMIIQQNKSGTCSLSTVCSAKSDDVALLEVFFERMYSEFTTNLSCVKLIQQSIVLSAANANSNCLRFLIQHFVREKTNTTKDLEISVDCIDTLKGETALTLACSLGHRNICELLVEYGHASLFSCNSKSWTPLLCAVKAGEWEIVEFLLTRSGHIINQADKHGRTALIMAASEGHLAIIDILIEKGANKTCYDRDGLSALSWACLKGQYNAALALINSGINVNHADFSGRTPLDLATFYGDVRLVQLLVERGAQLDHVDNIGMRPLDRAIGCRNVPVVVFFLKKGAKLSPATWAMASGKPEIIITLLNKLVEDGNTLYRKGSYEDALHRYSYTLRKFPKDPAELVVQPNGIKAILEMKFNLLLNLARCHRKLEDYQSSIELCTRAIDIKQDSYEAFYSRARAKRDARQLDSALDDLMIATQLCPSNGDIKKLISKVNEEKHQQQANVGLSSTLQKKEKQQQIQLIQQNMTLN